MEPIHPTIGIGQPRYLASNGDAAALLIHGISSYPGIMDGLASEVHARGITVSAPRLPGHATDPKDLVRSRGRDWLSRVRDSYLDLRGNHERVYVVGLSLGGILATLVASEFNPAGLVLLAPAVLNTNRLIKLTPLLRYLVKRVSNTPDPQGQDMSQPELQYLSEAYWSWSWVGPIAEIGKLQRKSKRGLRSITAPCLTLVAAHDRTVPAKVGAYIERRISSNQIETIVLERSKHSLVTDCERDTVNRLVVDRIVTWESSHGDRVRADPSAE